MNASLQLEVELSGEVVELAQAELASLAEGLGASISSESTRPAARIVALEVPDMDVARELVARLSLAHRVVRVIGSEAMAKERLLAEGKRGVSASFRLRGHPTAPGSDPRIHWLAQIWKSGGGTIDLEHPARRFWVDGSDIASSRLLEEVGAVDRGAIRARRISRLPFSRPVGLDPRLARAAANLALAGPGRRIVDPFVGTGALLAEAALLGADVTGVDVDLEMIRGAARNLEAVGHPGARLLGGDAGTLAERFPDGWFDALLTDAPYGRASGTGGEPVSELIARVLPLWARRVRDDGRVVLVTAGGPDPLSEPWRRTVSVPVRQHRSLTREFRVYRRSVSLT